MCKNAKAVFTEKGITYKDLAEFLNLSEKTIQNKMNGITDWSFIEVTKICKYLCPEYNLDWLFAQDKSAV